MTDHNFNREPWAAVLGRNPSWRVSAGLAVKRVLFYGPSAWWWLNKPYIMMAGMSLAGVAIHTLLWIVTTIALACAGLCGFLVAPSPNATVAPPNRDDFPNVDGAA